MCKKFLCMKSTPVLKGIFTDQNGKSIRLEDIKWKEWDRVTFRVFDAVLKGEYKE